MIRGICEDVLRRVYDFSDMTNEELRCKFFQKLQECIELCNNTSDIIDWIKNVGLPKEVKDLLTIWLEDGTLEELINIDILNKKVDKEVFDATTENINNNIATINEQLDNIENEKANTNYVENINNNFKIYSLATLENYEDNYLLAYDGFERENETLITKLEIGGTWTTTGGTWKIQNGLAYTTGQEAYSLAYTSCGNSDCTIEVDLKNVSICEKSGIAFRVVDDRNFLFVGVHQGHLGLYRCNNGVISLFKGTDLGDRIYTDGKITVVLRGINIKIYYDSFLKIDLDFDLGATSVKHGLVVGSTNSNARFDNFKITKSNLTKLEKNISLKTDNSENNWYWSFEKDITKPYSQQFINNELRIELRKTDQLVAGSYRSEVRLPHEQACESHIYSFDIKLSDVQGEFNDDVSPEILAQFHASANPDGTNFSAPLSLMSRNGNFIIDINWDDYYTTSNDQITQKGNNASINLGAYEKGKWYNFTFKVKWGWHKALKPMLEIYQDGVLVVNRPYMPNCMNNINGNYFKVGIYKYDWKNPYTQSKTTKRVVYYRNVKVL